MIWFLIVLSQFPFIDEYKAATVLFSDVVAFAQILKRCLPHQVVQLLTELHQEFNRVCKVHQTFRVSSDVPM